RCEPGVGCVTTPKDCDDDNDCTLDVCRAGECRHVDQLFCNDNHRCTTDICVPLPEGGFDCLYQFEPSNCSLGGLPLGGCATWGCSVSQDCSVVLHDDMCPQPELICENSLCVDQREFGSASGCVRSNTCGSPNCECMPTPNFPDGTCVCTGPQ